MIKKLEDSWKVPKEGGADYSMGVGVKTGQQGAVAGQRLWLLGDI